MKKTFDNILLATDSPAASLVAIQRTCNFAIKFGSDITALFITREKEKDFEDSINYIKGYTSSKGIKLEIVHKKGALNTETVKQLRQESYSLVILGASENSVKVKWGSSEVYKVITNTKCPVISYCENAEIANVKEIVLPLTDSPNTRLKVPYCALLAKAFGSTVHIYGVSKNGSKDTQKLIESYIRQTERYFLERRVKYSVDSNYGVKVPDSIIAYGEHLKADLVVTMTDSESATIFSKSGLIDIWEARIFVNRWYD